MRTRCYTRIMKNSLKYVLLIGLIAGLVLALVKSFIANSMMGVLPFLTLVVQLGATVAIGLATAQLLKAWVANAQLVSVFALLFLYAGSNLLLFTQIAHYMLYLLLAGVLSAGLFYSSDRFFNDLPIKQNKATIAAVAFVVWLIICAALGPVITRLVWND